MCFLFVKYLSLVSVLIIAPVAAQHQHQLDTARANVFYEYEDTSSPLQQLHSGDSEYTSLKLEQPVHFYGESYDQIFLSTNGILTFNVEFDEYINQPFPLEYPAIAPFYSNVDTTGADSSTVISIFTTHSPEQLERGSDLVRYAFPENSDFEANELIVATWRNVGRFDSNVEKLNSYQVVLIANEEETYVQLLYPADGLNWLQGETGPLGLPDVRAQAGFIAEDGRHYILEGSGTDNVRFLTEGSNVDVPGVWLFRVGPISPDKNVEEPSNVAVTHRAPSFTCTAGGHKQCHLHADCHDRREGFCCVCHTGYYGNGEVCLKNDYPVRATGTISGTLNGRVIEEHTKLHSYIVQPDARSYTAINPLSAELGAHLRLAFPIFGAIGWLFAKPMNGAVNGYKLTGGKLLHSSKLSFESGEVLHVNQTFEGLNYWDLLAVRIELFGDVPQVPHYSKVHMADYIEEYRYVSPFELHSMQAHQLELVEEHRVLKFQLEQSIHFERCIGDYESDDSGRRVLQKVSKVVLTYFENDQALRTSVLTKIGVDAESNACTDGSANCGENTMCVPYEDTARCDCLHGYAPQLGASGQESCVDIDECALGTHVCDDNAHCTNTEGGFSCICVEGYEGNGYRCLINGTVDNYESATPVYVDRPTAEREEHEPTYSSHEEHEQENQPRYPERHEDECYRCSPDADCLESRCECRQGFQGDGFYCDRICSHDEVFEHGRCLPLLVDDHEVEPQCSFLGECICPESYELSEDTSICRFVGHEDEDLRSQEMVPCDVDSNCHLNASCEWNEHELRHTCGCNPGFIGDGYNCDLIDDSCAIRPEICDSHATCNYDESLGRSACLCGRGYEGDGHRCRIAAQCHEDAHCGLNAYCDGGVCLCMDGFERDFADICVPAGRCGGVVCGANAICKWDERQGVQYCDCIEGYEGDALLGCKSMPTPCNVRNNCGVHANCEPTEDPSKYECQCNAGFHGDGYVCVEEQNCLNNPQMCDMNAKCLSTNSGLVCVCNAGFYGNGSLCQERLQHESGFLLVSQGVVIARVPLSGKNVRPISVASMAIGLDKDCVEGRVYWGDISTKKIVSAKYDGTDSRPFITEDIESPEGIAIDAISRRIYWADSVKDTIEVASLDDPSLRTILINKNLVNPRGIAVDPYHERLYWSDWDRESPKIEMSALDGTGREVLLGNDTVTLPNSLAVLERSGEVCFADAGTKKVQCIHAYTKQLRTISTDLAYPFGLVHTHDQFYWTDWTTKKLESVDEAGNRLKGLQTPFYGSHKMYGMTAIEDECPTMNSPCQINNGGCVDARLCLPNRHAPSGKSCKCTKQSQSCNTHMPYGYASN